jgi:DNA primase
MIDKVLEHYGADLHRIRETGWQNVKCCFHEDAHASASVNLAKGGFACHACGIKGDAISLIKLREGLDYRGALTFAETVLGQSVGDLRRPASHDQPRRVSQWRDKLLA